MNDGWMHGRKEGCRGEWESWELAGMTSPLFSFNSSFAHHVFRCRQKQFVLCVFPSPSFPLPPLAFESFSSWVQFCSCRVRVSVCMVMSTSVLCGCVCLWYSHIHTCSSPRSLTNSQWKSVASLSVRTSGSGHFAVGSRCTLT